MGLLDIFKGGGGGSGKARRTDVRKRFELLREAISGTMSKFYMARDRESDEVVGLKVLNLEKTEAFESRFKGLKKPSEGEIAVQLKHPNIVRTLEHGVTSKDQPYLVMEFIDGPGFNSVLVGENQRMLDGTRVPLIRQIAEAIQCVHDRGFIHRDICPRNVMIDTQTGVLKLIDFGLTVPATKAFMQPGNRTGNPNYMAPELVRRKPTDQRVDVFAFGVTAYELCALQLPWQRGLTGKAAMDHANKPPEELQRFRPNINPTLSEAIAWCLEQDLNKRCPSMEAFLNKIRDVQTEDVA